MATSNARTVFSVDPKSVHPEWADMFLPCIPQLGVVEDPDIRDHFLVCREDGVAVLPSDWTAVRTAEYSAYYDEASYVYTAPDGWLIVIDVSDSQMFWGAPSRDSTEPALFLQGAPV